MKFEYKKFWCDSRYDFDLMKLLNTEGLYGWEAIHIDFHSPDTTSTLKARFVIMKRAK